MSDNITYTPKLCDCKWPQAINGACDYCGGVVADPDENDDLVSGIAADWNNALGEP